jgi:5-methyltetrahydrofolate--homocysteine methyltransferase
MGDAYPSIDMACFGPGVCAAFLGARLDNSTGAVWFHPEKEVPVGDLHLSFDPENVWLARVKDICAAALKRWQGQVLVPMTDLGGTLDILSTFRPADRLLYDLMDEPEEVKRLTWEIHKAWFACYDAINEVLQPTNPGYSSWCGIYSSVSYYMLQCDFSYMIGTPMFDEFVRPEIEASCGRLEHSFYHLDGKGQLGHLNSLLSIDRLDGIQWVPGAGAPNGECWPEVYQKIFAGGKKAQLVQMSDDPEVLRGLLSKVGIGPGTQRSNIWAHVSEKDRVSRMLESFGLEV